MTGLIKTTKPLGSPPWTTSDPFLFCVHHNDAYPNGNEQMAPATSLAGRDIGQDFANKDGWNMYHGQVVPGFPQHPHRGFETVTIMRAGVVDHSDSLGATARFGAGDTQWLTAGKGIVHAEMMPLLERDKPNPLELFQIWLNLPAKNKMAPPHFTMLWNEEIPVHRITDAQGRTAEITVIAGSLAEKKALPPPPHSWASTPDSEVAIWCVRMEPGSSCALPPTSDAAVTRTLYFFKGSSLTVGGEPVSHRVAVEVQSDREALLVAGDDACDILVLQGRPIGEPVAAYGPFVMNTREEIQRAVSDYQKTRFGGWPFKSDDPVHPRETTRFAKHADGRIETKG